MDEPAFAPLDRSLQTRPVMVEWTLERKRNACLWGPISPELVRADTQVIERPGWYQTITPSTSGTCNEVVLSQVEDRDAERVIDETIATYRAHGLPTKWCVGYWTRPEDFGERLARRGFESWAVRGMGCSTSLELSAAWDIAVRQVNEQGLERHLAVVMQGWGVPPTELDVWRGTYLARLRAQPCVNYYFEALLQDEVVGTASLILRGDSAYLMGAQVLETARGRGVYRALIRARLEFLCARGIEYATTQAREATSAPRLQHLGFETLFESKCYLLGA